MKTSGAASLNQSNLAQEKIFQQLQQVFIKNKQPTNMRLSKNSNQWSSQMNHPISLQNSSSSNKAKSIFTKQ